MYKVVVGLVVLPKFLEMLLSFVATGTTAPAVSLDIAGTWSAENNVLKSSSATALEWGAGGGSSVPRSMSENFMLQFQFEPLITGVRDLTIECIGGVSDDDITQTYEINNVGVNHIIITISLTGTGLIVKLLSL